MYQIDTRLYPFFKDIGSESLYDRMTGALTKGQFLSYGEYLVNKGQRFTVFFIDFDNFKKINDSLGHQIGDKALIEIVHVIQKSIGDKGIVFRYGGDEFMILAPNLQEYKDVWEIGREVCQDVRTADFSYLHTSSMPLDHVTITIGIARFPFDGRNLHDIIAIADKALYRGKMKGKNCFIIYLKELHAKIDISKHNIELEIAGILNHIFVIFRRHDESNILLSNAANFVATYYNATAISLIGENYDYLAYIANETNGMVYTKIPLKMLNFDPGDPWRIYYRNNLEHDKNMLPLFNTMKSHSIMSIVVFPTYLADKEEGYLFVYSRREKVWSDEEILAYQEIANLYGYLNYINAKWKKSSK